MDNKDEEFYKNNYNQMKNVEDFGDRVFIKANFFTPGSRSSNEGYINEINDISSVQYFINKILSNYDPCLKMTIDTEINLPYYPEDHDFLSDEDKNNILKNINKIIFNKIQTMYYRHNATL